MGRQALLPRGAGTGVLDRPAALGAPTRLQVVGLATQWARKRLMGSPAAALVVVCEL